MSSRSDRPSDSARVAGVAIVATVYTVIGAAILWGFDGLPTVVRVPLALPIVLFTPGYAVLSALFPGTSSHSQRYEESRSLGTAERAPSFLKRGVLSVVTSIAVVPMVALVANAVVGVQFSVILVGLTVLTVLATIVCVVRSPAELGLTLLDVRRWFDQSGSDGGRGVKHALTDGLTLVAVAITVVLLVSSAAMALDGDATEPPETEFFVAGENVTTAGGDGGTTDAAGTSGDVAFDLRIKHHGSAAQSYTVVVLLEENATASGESTGAASELDRFSMAVRPDETAGQTVRLSGDQVTGTATVRFLLYTGDAPQDPGPSSAHRALRVSTNATTG